MLNRRAWRALAKQQRNGKKVTVYVIIDDSLVEKSGKTLVSQRQETDVGYMCGRVPN